MSEYMRGRGALPGAGEPVWWFAFHDRDLLIVKTPGITGEHTGYDIPYGLYGAPDAPLLEQPLIIGFRDGVPCIAGMLAGDAEPPSYTMGCDLRRLFGLVDALTFAFAGYAYQIAYWQATSAFCPRCGSPATLNHADWGRTCTVCGLIGYPRVSPCAIVLIHDGARRVLLVRQPSWQPGVFSLVAGFVEAGESLEECLVREVREETGVAVDTIRYMGSQAWPFPHQLMVGFTARYAGGDLHIDPGELDDARWFDLSALPSLPGPLSIARQIIEQYNREAHPA